MWQLASKIQKSRFLALSNEEVYFDILFCRLEEQTVIMMTWCPPVFLWWKDRSFLFYVMQDFNGGWRFQLNHYERFLKNSGKYEKAYFYILWVITKFWIFSDALYPKKFCVSNPVLVSANGCQKYLSDICSLDVKLATSPPCAGSNSNFALKWLKSELVD